MLNKENKAITALEEAQKIAFSPFVFQASIALKRLRIFDLIFEHRSNDGIDLQEISSHLNLSEYGLSVLLEIAESSNLLSKSDEEKYKLTKTGYFLNFNDSVLKNLNFTNDVCYKGLFYLIDSIKTGKPEGLKEFGEWDTIYEGLSSLPSSIQKSWFEFDHHYSDEIFDEALDYVFKINPKHIYDIGANTGRFALKCLKKDPTIEMTLFDLPGQLEKASTNIKANGFESRVQNYEIDWLKDHPTIPKSADLYWMSQFLDCFSKDEILKILKACSESMTPNSYVYIIETLTDRQKFKNAQFVLEATSLYFTTLANGNSKMYTFSELSVIIEKAGLKIIDDISLGEFHTLLVCKLNLT